MRELDKIILLERRQKFMKGERLRVMEAFETRGRVIQAVIGFGDNLQQARDLAGRLFSSDLTWIERPSAPATRTIPGQYGNRVHFIEALRLD